MSRRLKTDIPGRDPRVSVEGVETSGTPPEWSALFAADLAAPLPLVVELGFGRGEFLMHLARESPERAHIGVEVSRKRVFKMARRVARAEIGNIRLVHANAAHFVAHSLAPESVSQVWINFSDPWPKTRHHRRRLVQAELIEQLCEVLVSGARVEIATDDVPYAEHIDQILRAEPRLENAFAPDAWLREVPGRFPTAYERAWRAEGRPLRFWRYRKR